MTTDTTTDAARRLRRIHELTRIAPASEDRHIRWEKACASS